MAVEFIHRQQRLFERIEKIMSDVLEYELHSHCECEEWDSENDCPVLDSDGNPVPARECYGCWSDTMANIRWDMLAPFLSANSIGEDDRLYIGGDGIGWQRRSGYTIAKPTIEDIVQRLGGDMDFTLYFKFDGKDLSVRRSSHDEPTGTGPLVFRLATDEEIEFWEYSR